MKRRTAALLMAIFMTTGAIHAAAGEDASTYDTAAYENTENEYAAGDPLASDDSESDAAWDDWGTPLDTDSYENEYSTNAALDTDSSSEYTDDPGSDFEALPDFLSAPEEADQQTDPSDSPGDYADLTLNDGLDLPASPAESENNSSPELLSDSPESPKEPGTDESRKAELLSEEGEKNEESLWSAGDQQNQAITERELLTDPTADTAAQPDSVEDPSAAQNPDDPQNIENTEDPARPDKVSDLNGLDKTSGRGDLLQSKEADLLSAGEEAMLAGPLLGNAAYTNAGGTVQYLKDTQKRSAYHDYRRMSQSTDSSMSDGLHTGPKGVRAYKSGKYFIDGAFTLNGARYYADENGYLVGGWLKTLQQDYEGVLPVNTSRLAHMYRYYDPQTHKLVTGLNTIDGILHYFDNNGVMYVRKDVSLDGKYYYCDRNGVCGEIRLKNGNKILGIENQNNDAYLAKKQVQAVNLDTFTGQKGAYSFRPKWYNGLTTLEVFGTTTRSDGNGRIYCELYDDSLKGKTGCIYRNVGRYKGRMIDLRCTVTDYTFYNFMGEQEIGYYLLLTDRIGVNTCNTRDITVDMAFLDHETGSPVALQGYATFADIDITQGVCILSAIDEVFVDQNCVLYKDPQSMTFIAPWETRMSGSAVTDINRENWVQVNYSADHLSFRFLSGGEAYSFTDGTDLNVENFQVWKNGYSGNTRDYTVSEADNGAMHINWQGLYYARLGRISIPPVTKTVSDRNETDKSENTLTTRDESFVYTINHAVPGEYERFYYTSYQVIDQISPDLSIKSDAITIEQDNGNNVTSWFSIQTANQTVTISATPQTLAREDFYDNNYRFKIPVTLKPGLNLSTAHYQVKNKAKVTFNRSSGKEETESNETLTHHYQTRISIKKTDKDTHQILTDAGFTIYPYSNQKNKYQDQGIQIPYNAATQTYQSSYLPITEDNLTTDGKARYLVKETKVPADYKDLGWQQELILAGSEGERSIEVQNEHDRLPTGTITIRKRILASEIHYPHGNPTFQFLVTGKDQKGIPRQYEEFLTFTPNNNSPGPDGYSTLAVTIKNVPAGTYQIYEATVSGYRLENATPDEGELSIQTTTPQGLPIAVEAIYGTGTLSQTAPRLTITFQNKKSTFKGLRHNAIATNPIPIIP